MVVKCKRTFFFFSDLLKNVEATKEKFESINAFRVRNLESP